MQFLSLSVSNYPQYQFHRFLLQVRYSRFEKFSALLDSPKFTLLIPSTMLS